MTSYLNRTRPGFDNVKVSDRIRTLGKKLDAYQQTIIFGLFVWILEILTWYAYVVLYHAPIIAYDSI